MHLPKLNSSLEGAFLYPSFYPEVYAMPPLTREERAGKARTLITQHFSNKLQVFLDFVLAHYVSIGVKELDQVKLTPLLKLKYHDSIPDAIADLEQSPTEIGVAFAGFQKYLYQQRADG
jgi:type I restriction enzyme R subunit